MNQRSQRLCTMRPRLQQLWLELSWDDFTSTNDGGKLAQLRTAVDTGATWEYLILGTLRVPSWHIGLPLLPEFSEGFWL